MKLILCFRRLRVDALMDTYEVHNDWFGEVRNKKSIFGAVWPHDPVPLHTQWNVTGMAETLWTADGVLPPSDLEPPRPESLER